jgi:hypothetical protein
MALGCIGRLYVAIVEFNAQDPADAGACPISQKMFDLLNKATEVLPAERV